MTAGQFPDAEALVVAYLLRNGSAVSTAVGGRVYTQIPETATLPLIRVTRVGGPPTSDEEDAPRIQIEAWADAGAQSAAMDVIRAVVAAVPAFAGKQPTSDSWVVAPYVTNGPVASEDVPTGQERYWTEIGFNTYVEGT
jgi:Protein of unknown function (DUF3168)